jgi:hypothetical protein
LSTLSSAALVTDINAENDDNFTSDFGPSVNDLDTTFQLDHLSVVQRRELNGLLKQYQGIFSDKPGRTGLCTHAIELLPGTKPIRSAPYRVNPQKAECIQQELQLMLDLGVIEESNSPFASPIVLVPKHDGSIRFWYRFSSFEFRDDPRRVSYGAD